jgi:hypothetical protein
MCVGSEVTLQDALEYAVGFWEKEKDWAEESSEFISTAN